MSAYTEAAAIRAKLAAFGEELGDLNESRFDLKVRMGKVLLEVRETPRLSMDEAAELLGITRPTAYRWLEEARRRS